MLKLNPNLDANMKKAMESIERAHAREQDELAELIVKKLIERIGGA